VEFSEDTLFEGVIVKRGDEDGPPIGEVLIYERDGRIEVVVPSHADVFRRHADGDIRLGA